MYTHHVYTIGTHNISMYKQNVYKVCICSVNSFFCQMSQNINSTKSVTSSVFGEGRGGEGRGGGMVEGKGGKV